MRGGRGGIGWRCGGSSRWRAVAVTASPDTEPIDTGGPTTDSEPVDTAGTGDTHETEETGDTSPPPEECPREEGLEITALEVGAPWTAHELSVDVITSAPAAVAVICTLDADPAERHLAESPEGTPPPHGPRRAAPRCHVQL